jgi:hypothetical protein
MEDPTPDLRPTPLCRCRPTAREPRFDAGGAVGGLNARCATPPFRDDAISYIDCSKAPNGAPSAASARRLGSVYPDGGHDRLPLVGTPPRISRTNWFGGLGRWPSARTDARRPWRAPSSRQPPRLRNSKRAIPSFWPAHHAGPAPHQHPLSGRSDPARHSGRVWALVFASSPWRFWAGLLMNGSPVAVRRSTTRLQSSKESQTKPVTSA